ncbi:LytR C-terminal domain-containing protein [Geodermatophilus sp. SYSU D00766]
MGRHAASGGDQPDRLSAPVAGGRRRTDPAPGQPVPDGSGAPDGTDWSDAPTLTGPLRSRAERRRDALLGDETDRGRPLTGRPGRPAVPARPIEPARPAAAPRPPADGATRQAPAPVERAARPAPVPQRPAPARPAAPPPLVPPTAARLPAPPSVSPPAPQAAAAPAAPARPAAPLTTVAPFQAVPTPQLDTPAPAAAPLDPWDLPARPAAGGRAPQAARAAAPAAPPAAPASAPAAAPVAPPAAPATAAIPDREVARGRAAAPLTEAIPDREVARGRAAEPLTEAIPDRDVRRGERTRTPEPETGPSTGLSSDTGVVGNRAAMRAERQAREAERQAMESERRKAARRAGVSRAALRAAATAEEDAPPRRGRTVPALLAVVVVALVVLGVYSFTSSATQEAGSTSTPPQTSAPASVAAPSGALPELSVEPLPPVAQAPSTPVRVPVTVLNATDVSGLAGDAADAFRAQGWESNGIGQYEGPGVAVTTVFVTAGDEQQQQSAVQLMAAFPGVVGGPAERFFEVPGVADPGLVVVVTGEWRP